MDQLESLLNSNENHNLSPPGSAPVDNLPAHPPQPPAGSLPPGGQSQNRAFGKSRIKHQLPAEAKYHLRVAASRNNTILTFTDAIGNPRAWVSSGRCGFKNVQRSSYEAGYQCAVKMFEKIAEERKQSPGNMHVEILFKGIGAGREALYRALMTTEGEKIRDMISQLTDSTPLKVGGGTRAKKARRL